jgi:signal transduction histidine kinase
MPRGGAQLTARTRRPRRSALALLQAEQEAERASLVKQRFLATMSHELRTPLTTVLGFSEVLADGSLGELTPRQQECLGHILDAGRRLLALINDLLDLTKIEADRVSLDLCAVDVAALLRDLLASTAETCLRQRIDFEVDIEEGLPSLEGDPRRLRQVFHNLFDNALKFTPAGGRIAVRAAVREGGDGSELVLAVVDSGIGIDPDDQPRLFEAFEQVDSSLARAQQGTGIGLALSRKLVEMHGGRLWLESGGRGAGSAFFVALPLSPPAGPTPPHGRRV